MSESLNCSHSEHKDRSSILRAHVKEKLGVVGPLCNRSSQELEIGGSLGLTG